MTKTGGGGSINSILRILLLHLVLLLLLLLFIRLLIIPKLQETSSGSGDVRGGKFVIGTPFCAVAPTKPGQTVVLGILPVRLLARNGPAEFHNWPLYHS